MSRHPIPIGGRRFGYLTALTQTDERRHRSVVWICRCDCGEEVRAASEDLRRGDKTSCGCRGGVKKTPKRPRKPAPKPVEKPTTWANAEDAARDLERLW